MEEDLGWQKTPLMKKFHYFATDEIKASRYQFSLCRNWSIPTLGSKPDVEAPKHQGEECVKCVRAFEKTYGASEGSDAEV